MVYGIEITQKSNCTKKRSGKETGPVFSGARTKASAFPQQDKSGNQHSDKVSEKAFLDCRDITCKPHEHISAGEEKCCQENIKNTVMPGLQFQRKHQLPYTKYKLGQSREEKNRLCPSVISPSGSPLSRFGRIWVHQCASAESVEVRAIALIYFRSLRISCGRSVGKRHLRGQWFFPDPSPYPMFQLRRDHLPLQYRKADRSFHLKVPSAATA